MQVSHRLKYLTLGLGLLFLQACKTDIPSYDSVNQIAINNQGQIEIVGTASGISQNIGIKSPYILNLDQELATISKHTFPTETTVLNPKLLTQNNGHKILSYYRAEAIGLQTEHSHLVFLDENNKVIQDKKHGHRTRIKCLSMLPNNSLLAYEYEREKLNTSLSIFKDSVIVSSKEFALSEESNMPTDLLINQGDIYISGIGNGFHYRDGHEYKNAKTFGYLFHLDQELNKLDSFIFESEQHSFINDIEINDDEIISTGSIQSDSTGFDMVMQVYNQQLEKEWEYVHKTESTQKGIKSIVHNERIYSLASSINSKTKKSTILLLRFIDKKSFHKELELEINNSYSPKDFIIHDDQMYIIATKQLNRTSKQLSVLIHMDLDGNFIKEIKL